MENLTYFIIAIIIIACCLSFCKPPAQYTETSGLYVMTEGEQETAVGTAGEQESAVGTAGEQESAVMLAGTEGEQEQGMGETIEGFYGGYYPRGYPYDYPYPYYYPLFYSGCNENVFGEINCLPTPYAYF